MAISPEDALAFHMHSAKVVSTIDGDALLIGGEVYYVTGPDGNAADKFSIALRRMGATGNVQHLTSGSLGSAIGGKEATATSW